MAQLLVLMIVTISQLKITECKLNGCDSPQDQTGTSGSFTSHPAYPGGSYFRSSNCLWHIKVATGHYIGIKFDSTFVTEKAGSTCVHDYITFERSGFVIKGPFCGLTAPADFKILRNDVTVRFKADSSGQMTGFKLTWTAVSGAGDAGCDSPKDQSGLKGKVGSMNYPANYENSAKCDWDITVPVGYRIKLQFDSPFDLEFKLGSCKDYVTTQKTDNTGHICNPSPPTELLSWNNNMAVKFQSDSENVGKGFSITWTAVSAVQPSGCGQVDQKDVMTGTFSSMNYPSNYDSKAYCFWRITALAGYSFRIRLQFNTKFNTEKDKDMVSVYEVTTGPVVHGPFSGTTAPSDITSKDEDLAVVFTSDASTNNIGFQVTWTTIDTDGNVVKNVPTTTTTTTSTTTTTTTTVATTNATTTTKVSNALDQQTKVAIIAGVVTAAVVVTAAAVTAVLVKKHLLRKIKPSKEDSVETETGPVE